MQQGNFIDIFLARHVSGTYAHHQELQMLSCSIWFPAPSFWMGGGLESHCVGWVYGADGDVRLTHGTIRTVEASWDVMAHTQKPDFVFQRNRRVHLSQRLLAAEVRASAVVILDTPCSEVVRRVLATHCIRQFPLHFPSRASLCAITFQPESTHDLRSGSQDHHPSKNSVQKTIRCNSTSNAPDDGRMYPKHVELRIHQ